MGPSAAVARYNGETMMIWSHGQGMHPLRRNIAEMLALDPANGEISERVDLGEPVNLPPVVADGTIYFLTDDGSLIARR